MGTWLNTDGLYVKYGTDEATVNKAGTFGTMADGHQIVTDVVITLTGLGTAAAIQSDSAVLPSGAFIEKVEVITETLATSGGSAVLNVGLIRLDRSTELDYDGLVAALALTAIDAAGETTSLVEGGTSHGALIGTALAYPGLITADYDTAAYTAGVVRVKIYWYKK